LAEVGATWVPSKWGPPRGPARRRRHRASCRSPSLRGSRRSTFADSCLRCTAWEVSCRRSSVNCTASSPEAAFLRRKGRTVGARTFPRNLRLDRSEPVASSESGRYGEHRSAWGSHTRERNHLHAAIEGMASISDCSTCFFGVEHLCCLRVEESKCPTFRACDGPAADCLRRRPRAGENIQESPLRRVSYAG
jgi:hypothetical protein